MKKHIFLLLILAFCSTLVFASDLSCYDVGGWSEGGHPWCGVSCPNADGTADLYIMSCDSDYFQIYQQ